MKAKEKNRVAVAMSGGVDSSVAAVLALELGFSPIGVTMKIWTPSCGREKGDRRSCIEEGVESARQAAELLGIPLHVLDVRKEFRRVVDYFCREYLRGRTPNPCVRCNQWIKFGTLLRWAREQKADFLVTGHYARIAYSPARKRFLLNRALDGEKDQSYVLSGLSQRQLARVLTPLGNHRKSEVREIARRRGLRAWDRPESQDICFVPGGDYRRIVTGYAGGKLRSGFFVDGNGAILGKHRGIGCYTIGQRRGLGIAAGKRKYVVNIDARSNRIVVGDRHEGRGRVLIAGGMNWIDREETGRGFRAHAKIRYNHPPAPCRVLPAGRGQVRVEFDEPQQFITPGQAVVFYWGDRVFGGGWIRKNIA